MLDTLDARLVQADAGELGHLEFLEVLCQDEITRRHSAALAGLGLDPSLAFKGYLATIRFGHCVIGLLRVGRAELLPLQTLAWPRQWVQIWPAIGTSQWPPASHMPTARLTPIAVGIRQSQFRQIS